MPFFTPVGGGGLPKATVTGTTGSPVVDTSSRAGKTIYKFTGSGSITVGTAGTCEVLVVGGGGSPGVRRGGAGGGGGYLYKTDAFLSAGTLTVTVGAGGALSSPTSSYSDRNPSRGNHSQVAGYVAIGGGEGGPIEQSNPLHGAGGSGGSGGGAGLPSQSGGNFLGGVAMVTGQGFNAGTSFAHNSAPFWQISSGGGGAGGASQNASSGSANGGPGATNSITGSSVAYAGGGGGGGYNGAFLASSGGTGGGGNASVTSGVNGSNGTANTGGGGGGYYNYSGGEPGTGGSGVVIVVIG